MAITQAIANNFKKLLLEGDSNFSQTTGDKYKLALILLQLLLTQQLLHLQQVMKLHQRTIHLVVEHL